MEFTSKVAFITGGGARIDLASTNTFACAGMRLATGEIDPYVAQAMAFVSML